MTALDKLKADYVALYAGDIRANPACYKASVVADPDGTAAAHVEYMDEADVRAMLRSMRQELRAVAKAMKGQPL